MPLELNPPDDLLQDQDELPLAIADITEFHAELENYIDKKVSELRKQYTGLPPGTIRATLVKGQCLCNVAMRLLKEELKQ